MAMVFERVVYWVIIGILAYVVIEQLKKGEGPPPSGTA